MNRAAEFTDRFFGAFPENKEKGKRVKYLKTLFEKFEKEIRTEIPNTSVVEQCESVGCNVEKPNGNFNTQI